MAKSIVLFNANKTHCIVLYCIIGESDSLLENVILYWRKRFFTGERGSLLEKEVLYKGKSMRVISCHSSVYQNLFHIYPLKANGSFHKVS